MAIKDLAKVKKHLFLCNGEPCILKGANQSIKAIRQIIKRCGLHDQIHTTRTLCNGRCDDAPIVIVQPDGIWYKQITEDKAEILVMQHLRDGIILEDNVLFKYGADYINSNSKITEK